MSAVSQADVATEFALTMKGECYAFAHLALQLRRQWHERRRWAVAAAAAGKTDDATRYANHAARHLDNARWYLAKAKDRRPLNPEN